MPFYKILAKTTTFVAIFCSLSSYIFAQTVRFVDFGTHGADDTPAIASPIPWGPGADDPSSLQKLFGLDSNGAVVSGGLEDTSAGDSYDGDLIEIGFFNTNTSAFNGDSGDYTPNTSTTNLFQGVWTPLTSKTTIGRDWDGRTVGAGEFFFKAKFEDGESDVTINQSETNTFDDPFSGVKDAQSRSLALDQMFDALEGATNPLLGIRFYDISTTSGTGGLVKSSGATRYNTIMNPNWEWNSSAKLYLHKSNGVLDSDIALEFDVGDYNSISTVGSSHLGVNAGSATHNEFVTAVTFYDGNSELSTSGVSHILSGLESLSSSAKITGGESAGSDNNITIHTNTGNSFEFEGDIEGASGNSALTTLIKTGGGTQILSGDVLLAGEDSGWLNVNQGSLTLKPASGKTQSVEYITGTGSGTLTLDNSGVNDGTIVTLGFSNANNTSSTFSGNVILDGNGDAGESKIKVSKSREDAGFDAADFADSQTISGAISNATGNKKLVKDGTGELILTGNNTFTGGVEIDDGTLVVGHANALGSSNTVTITKGKLEVDNGVTLAPTTITAGDSEKTMIGGRGTLSKEITIGEGNGEIDVISPGDGISSSLSNSSSQQQVSLGDRTNAIGTFTVSDTMTLASGGVFDWEVSDFTGSEGNDWDLLKFDTLTLSATSADPFIINVMSLASDGTAGAMAGGNVWQNYTSNGFKFMEHTGVGSIGSGWDTGNSGLVNKFSVVSNNWGHYNDQHLHDWNVWYDGSSAFYLQYSAVPEPSTYMMVTGLLMVPGMSYVRRFRKRKASETVEEEPQV